MKIGILGGTFDPFHIAHAYMAEETLRLLDLDEIIVMPNQDPPHKDISVTPAYHRLKMAELALEGYEKTRVLDFEMKLAGPSYTYKTLELLKEGELKNDEIFFIIGRDSLITFHHWVNPERILQCSTLVCFDRPGYRDSEVKEASEIISSMGGKLILIDSAELEISSTEIRKRFQENTPIRSFLRPDVYRYIMDNGLYTVKK